jgi:hypothetical protein
VLILMRTFSHSFADSRCDAELFEQFSRERFVWSFSALDLAARELPKPGEFLSGLSASEQDTTVLSNDCRCDNSFKVHLLMRG